jgi:hypothetical protein
MESVALYDVLRRDADLDRIKKRFKRHIVLTEDEHWIWKHLHSGDGQFYITCKQAVATNGKKPTGKLVSARRMIYLLTYGTIPEDTYVKSICMIRGCMNPKHLRVYGNESIEAAVRGISVSDYSFLAGRRRDD